jgi:hypothetical protein
VSVILAAGFFSLIAPIYFLLLMADARKLERRLLGRQTECAEEAPEDEQPLIAYDTATWIEASGQPAIPDSNRFSSGPN